MLFAKKAKWAAKSGLYRKLLAEKIINDIPRFAKDKWDDFDADDVLRHIGLTTTKPVKSSLGGLGAFIIGAAVGSVVALMLAPTPGVDLRTQVKDKAMGYLNKQNINLGQEKTANA
ncbi:YtxH domain-containing protein [Hyalangium rubrum]|uniref:YtxH domain-containing protein n=1 Tax=Hyalangium rubrum TaxID=3103134 RepID=A0ABU5HCG5_9BACT|nr:YtxH domain-containing protein [Hyalangium sp. s54d21]MDY7231158.1 YtxH domain-containing protein [Hyalangium sp. s54d21]